MFNLDEADANRKRRQKLEEIKRWITEKNKLRSERIKKSTMREPFLLLKKEELTRIELNEMKQLETDELSDEERTRKIIRLIKTEIENSNDETGKYLQISAGFLIIPAAKWGMAMLGAYENLGRIGYIPEGIAALGIIGTIAGARYIQQKKKKITDFRFELDHDKTRITPALLISNNQIWTYKNSKQPGCYDIAVYNTYLDVKEADESEGIVTIKAEQKNKNGDYGAITLSINSEEDLIIATARKIRKTTEDVIPLCAKIKDFPEFQVAALAPNKDTLSVFPFIKKR